MLYVIGIHSVGLMTGTKGCDDAVRRRDHLRYASLFSLSPPFFSPFASFIDRRDIHTRNTLSFSRPTLLVSRLDEISVGTSDRNDSNSFGVFFLLESRRTSGGKWRPVKSGPGLSRGKLDSSRFPSLEISNSAQRHGSLDTENRLWPIPKTIPGRTTRRASDPGWKRSWPRNVRSPPPSLPLLHRPDPIARSSRTRGQTN